MATKLTQNKISTAILGIVLIIVLFQVYANILPEAQEAGDSMNDSQLCIEASGTWNSTDDSCNNQTGNPANATAVDYSSIPLSGLLSANGVVFLVIMAALLFIVVKSFMKDMK